MCRLRSVGLFFVCSKIPIFRERPAIGTQSARGAPFHRGIPWNLASRNVQGKFIPRRRAQAAHRIASKNTVTKLAFHGDLEEPADAERMLGQALELEDLLEVPACLGVGLRGVCA